MAKYIISLFLILLVICIQVGCLTDIDQKTPRKLSIDTGTLKNSLRRLKDKKDGAPNIGIMTQPAKGNYHKFGFKSLIPASYAEWIEQLGANVIPIPYTLDKDQIKALMYQLNGVLLPGGGTQVFGPSLYEFYRERVYYILDVAKELNEEGIHFPVWGTCMGYEQIVNWASGFTIWPTVVANYHVPRRVHWNKDLLKNSKFRKYLSDKDLSALENQQISFFNHKFSISKENFEKNEHLKKSLLPIGETYSKEGIDF